MSDRQQTDSEKRDQACRGLVDDQKVIDGERALTILRTVFDLDELTYTTRDAGTKCRVMRGGSTLCLWGVELKGSASAALRARDEIMHERAPVPKIVDLLELLVVENLIEPGRYVFYHAWQC